MRKVIGVTYFVLLVMFLVSAKTDGEEGEMLGYKQKENNDVITIFVSPLSSRDLNSVVRQNGIQPKEIYYEMHGVYGGYTLQSGEDIEAALKNMKKKHFKFLRFALTTNKKAQKSLAKRDKTFGLKELNKQLSKVLRDTERGEFRFSGMKIENDEKVFPLLDQGVIQNFSDQSAKHPERRSEQKTEDGDRRVYSWYHESWAPFGGTSNVTKSQTYQTFYFNNVSEFGSTATYEHETQVYNKNFADYDGYWSSNLPRAYYDTPALDTMDNFTVGSAEASSIQTYTRYYTYMGLRSGSASNATVKIRGQKGHRIFDWCYSTWCIKAEATTFPGRLAELTAPGKVNWMY